MDGPVRLGVVATHPIQYQVPWYRGLQDRAEVDLTVFYSLLPDAAGQGVGFGVPFEWDVPLLDGYDWTLLPNARAEPGLDGFFAGSTPTVRRELAAASLDAVVITGWHALPMLQALAASLRLGLPRLVRGESNALRDRALHARLLHRLLLPRFDAYLAIGEASRDFYLGYGVPARRIFTAPYFVDNERFARQAAEHRTERRQLRGAWDVPEGATCFVFAGKLEPKKRPLDLLRAVGLARATVPVHLLVVGAGELMEEARALAEAESLPVTFTGFLNQTEITRAYVAADCLVLPSDFGETWGLVVNEAMACGLPALVSDRVGCRPDLIVEGETGRSFPFGDVDALAARLVEAASDPSGLRRMGRAARERVGAYSAEAAVEGTLEALRYLAGAGRLERSPAAGRPPAPGTAP